MRPVLLFDVNETLLDLRALDEPFARVLGDASLRGPWFAQMLQVAFVGVITEQYVDFTQAQYAALEMVARRAGASLAATDADEIVGAMSTLPAHPDVRPALERLARAGFRLATLTNSVESTVEAQLANAGLRDLFERALSADSVRRLKPAAEPYHMAARAMSVQPDETCLVAAHAWDVAGALSAGCQAAFVARPGALLFPVGLQPAVVGRDLGEIADRLIERWPSE